MKKLQTLRLTILSDNVAGRRCRAEHGLSFLIEADQTILFDTGSGDLIEYNAQILNINLNQIETVVLSHGHDDHSGGLMSVTGKKLICHPDAFLKRTRKPNHSDLGIKWTEEEIRNKFQVTTSREPIRISEQIWFLGEIPRITDFESRNTAFVKGDGSEDFVLDDSGLAISTKKGLVVISGCAHSGICNMAQHAINLTGIRKVHLVIGGFHLQNDDLVTRKTIDWMKSMQVEKLVPSHCSSFSAQAAIQQSFPFLPVKTGNIIEVC
ncbi:MAG: MBL fold metallo-hydrolase [Prolixibacteraceae bacterium]